MHMVFLVNLVHSSKYFTSFGIIHILMNENGVSFIRIHYSPFLSGNQSKNPGVWIIESNHHYREERCC